MGPMPALSRIEGMMGGGTLVMLFILLLIVGVPLLAMALVAGGRLASQSRPPAEGNRPTAPPATALSARRCPTCERAVQLDWNVCPYCGAELV